MRNETGPPRGAEMSLAPGPQRTADMPLYRDDSLGMTPPHPVSAQLRQMTPRHQPTPRHQGTPRHHATTHGAHSMAPPSSGPYSMPPPMHTGYGTMGGG